MALFKHHRTVSLMKTKICFQMMIDGCANYSFETESVEEPLTNEENETTAESYVFVQVQKSMYSDITTNLLLFWHLKTDLMQKK
jgi:hypothetical protein